jgi:hypothetical protein
MPKSSSLRVEKSLFGVEVAVKVHMWIILWKRRLQFLYSKVRIFIPAMVGSEACYSHKAVVCMLWSWSVRRVSVYQPHTYPSMLAVLLQRKTVMIWYLFKRLSMGYGVCPFCASSFDSWLGTTRLDPRKRFEHERPMQTSNIERRRCLLFYPKLSLDGY